MIWILGLNLFVGCRAEAPEDYDALISYMIEHYHDDPAYLEDGVEQLFALLGEDVAKKLGRGQRMQTLTPEAIETLEPGLLSNLNCWGLFGLEIFPIQLKTLRTPTFWCILGMFLPIQMQ